MANTSEVSIGYLANGLPERLELTGGQWLQVEYNDARQLISLSNAQGERIDITPNLVSSQWEQLHIEGQSHTQHTRYSYTHGNQLASITYPNGQRIDYHYRQGQALLLENNF